MIIRRWIVLGSPENQNKMLSLRNVTLILISSVQIEDAIRSIEKSCEKITFFDVILVSHEKPKNLMEWVSYEYCDRITDIKEYSRYVIYDLHKHIKSDYCLLIQPDGYVVRPEKWNDDFLKWDYIGAPWPLSESAYIDPFGNHIRVGNGGFSLRSKKLLNVPNETDIVFEVNEGEFYKHMNAGCYNEDGNICVHNRHVFEKHGCEFAPVDLAAQFSQESDCPEIIGVSAFGFHSVKR